MNLITHYEDCEYDLKSRHVCDAFNMDPRWRYCTIYSAIFCGDIPWNIGPKNRQKISGRYLQWIYRFRFVLAIEFLMATFEADFTGCGAYIMVALLGFIMLFLVYATWPPWDHGRCRDAVVDEIRLMHVGAVHRPFVQSGSLYPIKNSIRMGMS